MSGGSSGRLRRRRLLWLGGRRRRRSLHRLQRWRIIRLLARRRIVGRCGRRRRSIHRLQRRRIIRLLARRWIVGLARNRRRIIRRLAGRRHFRRARRNRIDQRRIGDRISFPIGKENRHRHLPAIRIAAPPAAIGGKTDGEASTVVRPRRENHALRIVRRVMFLCVNCCRNPASAAPLSWRYPFIEGKQAPTGVTGALDAGGLAFLVLIVRDLCRDADLFLPGEANIEHDRPAPGTTRPSISSRNLKPFFPLAAPVIGSAFGPPMFLAP